MKRASVGKRKEVKVDLDAEWEKMQAKWASTSTFVRDTPPKATMPKPKIKAKKIKAKNVEAPLQGYLMASTPRSTAKVDRAKSYGLGTAGAGTKKDAPRYTGTKVLGVGVMHKSSMVPIFSDQEAVEIATMRRG